MKKDTLLAVAQGTRDYKIDFAANKKMEGGGLSFISWLNYTESSMLNSTRINMENYAKDYHDADVEENNPEAEDDVLVMGADMLHEVEEKRRLATLDAEKEQLAKEGKELGQTIIAAKRALAKKKELLKAQKEKEELGTIEEVSEDESTEEKEQREAEQRKKLDDEKAAIDKMDARVKEIKVRTRAINDEKRDINAVIDKKEKARKKEKAAEKVKKAKETKESSLTAYKEAQKKGVLSHLSLLCAAKDHLKSRTWKDYLFHPFRSIAENQRVSEMQDTFLRRYKIDEEQLKSIINTVKNGDSSNISGIAEIDENGVVKKEEAKPEKAPQKVQGEPVKEEPRQEEVDKVKLKDDVSLEKTDVEKSKPQDPSVKAPEITAPVNGGK